MNESRHHRAICDPTEIYARPASMYVADFIGASDELPLRFRPGRGRIRYRRDERRANRISPIAGAEAAYRIPPSASARNISVHPPLGQLRGAVQAVEYLGTTQIVPVALCLDGPLKTRIPAEIRVEPGETVALELDGPRVCRCSMPGPVAPCSALEPRHG